jgi:hypothetical protein
MGVRNKNPPFRSDFYLGSEGWTKSLQWGLESKKIHPFGWIFFGERGLDKVPSMGIGIKEKSTLSDGFF